MNNKWFAYIYIDEQENYIYTSGIRFQEFYQGIHDKPNNLLLIDGYPSKSSMNKHLFLEYITNEEIASFVQSDIVYQFGDFCWFDFNSPENLNTVSEQELAAFLYFSHRNKPLDGFLFDSIKNKYAYCAHDDDWYVKVYMKNPSDYKQVIEYKILKELKGRKRTISGIQPEIMEQLYPLFREGAVIDFEDNYQTGVRIYTIGKQNDMDSIHTKLDRLRQCLHGPALEYEPRTKKWKIYN